MRTHVRAVAVLRGGGGGKGVTGGRAGNGTAPVFLYLSAQTDSERDWNREDGHHLDGGQRSEKS